ncbi:flagellar biosynthesis protein FlgL [Rhizobium rhizosphaerae]|uniref:Flagellin n=1 Tax=Xaviernesmea rhizosphaerae TaxID=1672749 RepID=A0A1Q9AIL8_9HYPH|nr:flagellar hook-associated family protein [Xaviernesmea rhizosphaerae]OLP55095.1 flagellar biosynthesis protein FlgL [Xaviernesmea rhizosphaerae]
MKTTFVSSLAIQNAMRLTIQQSQTDIVATQYEMTSGQHYDLGVSLGGSTARSLDLDRELARMDSLKSTNSVVTLRLSASQTALSSMATAAQTARNALTALSGSSDVTLIDNARLSVKSALANFTTAANQTSAGEFIFSGINTDAKPMIDYTTSEGAGAKAAYQNALNGFMASQTPPLTSLADFSAAQMNDFISNTLEPMYLGNDWKANWSDASDQNMTSRISANEVVTSSTNINAVGARKFALASIIGMEMLSADMKSEARNVLSSKTISYFSEAEAGINAQRSELGVSEQRVKGANTALDAQVKLMTTHKNDLDGVDTYQASLKMTSLKTQLETALTLTGRLQQLSLVNYL